MTPYQLAKASEGRLSLSTCYRLARGDVDSISTDTVAVLCEVLGIADPGPLFTKPRLQGQRGSLKPAGK